VKGIAGEDREVDLLLAGHSDQFVQPLQKILRPPAEAAVRIHGAVARHAKVQVGEVQHAQRLDHDSIIACARVRRSDGCALSPPVTPRGGPGWSSRLARVYCARRSDGAA